MPDWKNLKEKAMAAVNNAADTVDRQITVTKLRGAVTQAQTALDQEFQQFGESLYAQLQTVETISRTDVIVTEATGRIAPREEALIQAQQALQSALNRSTESDNSVARCENCGEPIASSTKYCSACGHAVN